MTPRALTAAGLGLLSLLFIYAGGISYQLAVIGFATIAMAEWALIGTAGIAGLDVFAATCAVPVCGAAALLTGSASTGLVVAALSAVCLALVHRLIAVGVLLAGVGCTALLMLRGDPGGRGDLVFLAVVIWFCDVGAGFGRTRLHTEPLFPRLWPGLTEGSLIGGVLAATAGSVAFIVVWDWADGWAMPLTPLAVNRAVLFGAMIGAMAQAGDAMEGMLSRQYGREGSGSILPGHDSLLDRVAGLLAAAPVTLLMRSVGHGFHIWQ